MGIGIPGEDLLHHRGLDRVEPHPARIAGAFRVEDIAIGRASPGQQLPAAQLGLAPAPHAVGDQVALILGHGSPDLEQQLVMRIIAHRPIQKHNLAAALGEFVDQQHLMDIVARQTIGCGDQYLLEGGKGGVVAQAIQARAIELGAAIAIIAIDVLVGEMPLGMLGHMRPQAVKLLVNRLGLLLAAGRDSGIQSDFHHSPPVYVLMAPAPCRCRFPSPIVGGTPTHNPTVAHRHCGQSHSGRPARNVWSSSYPPAPG